MTLHVIRMPDLGEGIAEVELVAWRVHPGDTVAEDQILCDVMTDKAAVEIPSSVAGRVIALGGDVGQMMAVGSELIRIEGEAGAPIASGRPAAPPAAVPTAAPADAVKVEILNPAGRVVDTLNLGALDSGRHDLTWDATKLPPGLDYRFRINASTGAQTVAATPLMRDRVDAVVAGGDTLTLELRSSGTVPYSQIRAFN